LVDWLSDPGFVPAVSKRLGGIFIVSRCVSRLTEKARRPADRSLSFLQFCFLFPCLSKMRLAEVHKREAFFCIFLEEAFLRSANACFGAIAGPCRAGKEQTHAIRAGLADCSQWCSVTDDERRVMQPAPSLGARHRFMSTAEDLDDAHGRRSRGMARAE